MGLLQGQTLSPIAKPMQIMMTEQAHILGRGTVCRLC
jgi:hypothetical protein